MNLKTATSKTACSAGWITITTMLMIGSLCICPTLYSQVSDEELALVKKVEAARVKVIEKVVGSVVAVYGDDRQGGGSGVIVDPSGIALTNHHVISGAGVSGLGGLDDGKLYKWKLIGTDPGGDIAIIQLEGKDEFDWSPIGDSDKVRVGDWALAMGNPFLLAEDQVPTVTLGVVSGIERYQGGSASQLVYGNCIQIDSSINPGNSGGPLFNMNGEVIGINGRGSFRDRGRVNVGLGYAISSNQIKNFIPELLASKLVEHGTLDANFSNRDGKVVCSTINLDAPAAEMGLELGDELIQFEGRTITNANQFTNLICTLPENWPAHLIFKKEDGSVKDIHVRLYGLPYRKPPPPENSDGDDGDDEGEEPSEEQKRQMEKARAMYDMMSGDPGIIRDESISMHYAQHYIQQWKRDGGYDSHNEFSVIQLEDRILAKDELVGRQQVWLGTDGRFKIVWNQDGEEAIYGFDGETFWKQTDAGVKELSVTEAKFNPIVCQAFCMASAHSETPLDTFGRVLLDGADSVGGRVACRLKTLDEGDDWYYVWLQTYNESGKSDVRLLKAACEIDGHRNGGAILFDDWSSNEGFCVARTRHLTDGLSDTVRLTIKTDKMTRQTEVDQELFNMPAASRGN